MSLNETYNPAVREEMRLTEIFNSFKDFYGLTDEEFAMLDELAEEGGLANILHEPHLAISEGSEEIISFLQEVLMSNDQRRTDERMIKGILEKFLQKKKAYQKGKPSKSSPLSLN